MLNKMGIKAGIYHAGLSELQRRESQEDFSLRSYPHHGRYQCFWNGDR